MEEMSNVSSEIIEENGITIKQCCSKKTPGKHNVKLSVFRQFVLATLHGCVRRMEDEQSHRKDEGGGAKRRMAACDMIAASGIAGLQWKKHLGGNVHVTVVEQRNVDLLRENIKGNDFTASALSLDPSLPSGTIPTDQASSEIHVAECDPSVFMSLKAFDFVFLDPHKNPSAHFSTLFRNVRYHGVVCVVVPDTMVFARSPQVVRRYYGADCIKTEYLKELAVRIVYASLAREAARYNRGFQVLYSLCVEDYLLLALRVEHGPGVADATLSSLGHILHCRICEERAAYPHMMAPLESPYSILGCACRETVPGKTGVVLGPLWKGSIYDYECLTGLAASGKSLGLTPAFFSLLQRAMEDCLCDTPPSLDSLMHGLSPPPPVHANGGSSLQGVDGEVKVGSTSLQGLPLPAATEAVMDSCQDSSMENQSSCSLQQSTGSPVEENKKDKELRTHTQAGKGVSDEMDSGGDGKELPDSLSLSSACGRSVKRKLPESDGACASRPGKQLKASLQPAPCFFYNYHSKRLGKDRLPKQQAIIERLRAQGFQCCRTHFERYAIRTDASLKTVTALLGVEESKVVYVKGNSIDT